MNLNLDLNLLLGRLPADVPMQGVQNPKIKDLANYNCIATVMRGEFIVFYTIACTVRMDQSCFLNTLKMPIQLL